VLSGRFGERLTLLKLDLNKLSWQKWLFFSKVELEKVKCKLHNSRLCYGIDHAYYQTREQPKGTELSQVKVMKKDKQFWFLADFVCTTTSIYYCNCAVGAGNAAASPSKNFFGNIVAKFGQKLLDLGKFE